MKAYSGVSDEIRSMVERLGAQAARELDASLECAQIATKNTDRFSMIMNDCRHENGKLMPVMLHRWEDAALCLQRAEEEMARSERYAYRAAAIQESVECILRCALGDDSIAGEMRYWTDTVDATVKRTQEYRRSKTRGE